MLQFPEPRYTPIVGLGLPKPPQNPVMARDRLPQSPQILPAQLWGGLEPRSTPNPPAVLPVRSCPRLWLLVSMWRANEGTQLPPTGMVRGDPSYKLLLAATYRRLWGAAAPLLSPHPHPCPIPKCIFIPISIPDPIPSQSLSPTPSHGGGTLGPDKGAEHNPTASPGCF